jgi:hypothetical protein
MVLHDAVRDLLKLEIRLPANPSEDYRYESLRGLDELLA